MDKKSFAMEIFLGTQKGSAIMPFPKKQFYTEDDYWLLPEGERSELINGELVALAAPSRIHQEILNAINNTIYNYIKSKNGSCKVYPAPFAVKLHKDWATIVEPDISVICAHGKLTDRGCTGAPDWIIEVVSPGTSGHDYIRKLHLYETAGVREYWIVNPMKQNVTAYFFDGEGSAQPYTFHEIIPASIFEDLEIDLSSFTN